MAGADTVAPFAGAWIEMAQRHMTSSARPVAPFAGAWIEILKRVGLDRVVVVAPFAGAWIEMTASRRRRMRSASLPSRERGLKWIRVYSSDGIGQSLPSRERGLK